MLKSISAQAVLFGILILTVIYYAIILAIYYRKELKSMLQGKARRLLKLTTLVSLLATIRMTNRKLKRNSQ